MSDATRGREFALTMATKAPEGAATGATVGGALGAIAAGLVVLGVIAIPGLAIVAAGPVVATLAGLGAGAAAGGRNRRGTRQEQPIDHIEEPTGRQGEMSEASNDSKVIQTYRARHPKSAALYERARAVIPGGITHDGRHLKPSDSFQRFNIGPTHGRG